MAVEAEDGGVVRVPKHADSSVAMFGPFRVFANHFVSEAVQP